MVRQYSFIHWMICLSAFMWPIKSYALLSQTQQDFTILRDALLLQQEIDPNWSQNLGPVLVAPPQHLWEESRTDFASATMSLLKEVWTGSGSLIACSECASAKTRVSTDHQVQFSSGPLSHNELIGLLANERYINAKTVLYVRETAKGIELKIIRISDGAIMYQKLADSTEDLESAKPRLHLVDEMERRKRGEALAYTFIELGFYPNPLAHISFLEQWGQANQHMTGVTLALTGPNMSLGVTYRYFLSTNPKIQVGGSVLFPLQNALKLSQGNNSSFLVVAATAQYAFSPTFGVFASGNSAGTISTGISLYNPIWFPFML